jgi:hypothetical protein
MSYVFFHDLIHLLLMQREALCRGHGCGDDLLLTVSMDHKEDELPVCEMTLLHFLAEIKEIVVGDATYGILYNCLPKVIITLWGLDSYTT